MPICPDAGFAIIQANRGNGRSLRGGVGRALEGLIVTSKTAKTEDTFAENLEQTQESTQKATVVPRSDLTTVHHLAQKLIGELDKVPDGDMVGEILETALKLLRDQTNRADIKLINK